MDINKMTRKQFAQLPYIKDFETFEIEIDSVVLLPSTRHDSSGYNIFNVIGCKGNEPIGMLIGYDTFSIIMESSWNRVGIDCLRGSGLMRIFLPTNEYIIKPYLHQAVKK